ncbi:MAG: PmoA family protein [Prolixibacteraceae bacterium]|nr:PmoA family protein [Prolixibacteraceae bacterium]
MMKSKISAVLILMLAFGTLQAGKSPKVEFKNKDQEKKVEVYVDGKLFTAYIYPDNMEKQSLYPILNASGKIITRGYPMNPRPFERTDHPHHVGLWFNFGDVNGLDFWNNSFAIKAADKPKYGTVKFKKIVSENPKKGELITASEWVDVNNKVLLTEETTFTFSGSKNLRSIERASKLTAAQPVTFTENKEGLIGLRLDRAFEEPATKPEKFLDANGIETEVPAMNNEGVNGVYRNAEGISGGAVWSKRSPWVALRADKQGEIITIVILDNPKNPNYPAWSHARGYGLFATNNLGGRAFDKNTTPVKLELKTGESVVIKHKILIGGDLTDAEINAIAKNFK